MKNILKLTLVILFLISCKKSPESSNAAMSKNTDGVVRELTGQNTDKDQEYASLMEAFPKKMSNLHLDEPPKLVTKSELKFLCNTHFYVTLIGQGMQVDDLWEAFDSGALEPFKKY